MTKYGLLFYILLLFSVNGSKSLEEKNETVSSARPEARKINDVKDIFGDVKYCSEGTVKGIRFPKTRECTEAQVPCPDEENIIGIVTRYCNCKTAKWEIPNTTNCTHKWVSEIRNSLNNGDPAEQITAQLALNLERTLSRQLYGGDIIGSVSLSGDVLSLAKTQFSALIDRNDRQRRASNFTESLGTSGDELLSVSAVPVWGELESWRRIEHASKLMSVLEQSALLLADYTIESQRKLSYRHWAMEIDVREPEAYTSARLDTVGAVPMDDTIDVPAARVLSDGQGSTTSTVNFNSINKSPSISLPSLSVLKESSAPTAPTGEVAAQAFFHPGGNSGSASTLDRTRLRLGYYVFTTFGDLLTTDDQSIINSHIIGASVDDAVRSISLPDTEPATFTFYHLKKTGVSNPRCVFWDLNLKIWSTEGCQLISSNSTTSECACNHLTSFAILMDVSGNVARYSGALASALDVISIIGCSISIVCLSLSLATFTFFRSLYNVRNTIHRNLCLCLLIAELVFVIGMDRTSNATACSVVALLLHFFFLASFCWMLLEGYQLYLMLIQVFESNRSHVLLYYLFSYGFPAAVVAVTAGVAWHNYGTDTYCWIDTTTPTIWAFIAPIIIVIIANMIFLLIALRVVLSIRSRDRNKTDRLIGWLKGSATLLCLLGITWVFGFLTAVKGGTGTVFAWIFTICNSTQGIFIFFLHVVMNDKVRLVIVRWIRTGVCCLPDNASAYNSKSFLSSRQRILNMVKSQSRSDPSTASTDDKDNQLTPTSKTNQWLRQMSQMHECGTISSQPESDEIIVHRSDSPQNADVESQSTDPRGSQDLESDVMEKQAPVKRKKFPLGASEMERASTHRNAVIIERF
ncbi:unnamed protein product [Auanema sp. JU1783]|nr:unnamed protein product [Auanema sp. JU1783]